MNKEETKKRLKEIKENYEKLQDQIKQMRDNSLRLEGQYGLLKEMLEEDEENPEEIGD